jgi:O-antigen biosynthesis protein
MTPIEQHSVIYNNAVAAAKAKGQRMIDLGGAFSCPADFEAVDLQNAPVIADLTKRYPFDDNSIGIVRAYDFLEHIADKMHSLSEIHRVLIPGGLLLSMTPSTVGPDGLAGVGADCDPTHVARWNKHAFWYVTRPEKMRYIGNTAVRFMEALLVDCYPTEWHRQEFVPYTIADLVKQGA